MFAHIFKQPKSARGILRPGLPERTPVARRAEKARRQVGITGGNGVQQRDISPRWAGDTHFRKADIGQADLNTAGRVNPDQSTYPSAVHRRRRRWGLPPEEIKTPRSFLQVLTG